MSIDVECTACGKTGRVPEGYAGRRIKCPGCGNVITVSGGYEGDFEDDSGFVPPPLAAGAAAAAGQTTIVVQAPPKNPGLAAVLSFFYSGLGQIYNGEIGKGIVFLLVQMINLWLMCFVIGFITFPIVWIWGMIDAYRSAERINQGG